MPLFSELKYNNYVPQYVGAPLDEYLRASTAVQDRYNQVQEGYSLLGELSESLQTSPLEGDREAKKALLSNVTGKINEAAARGDFDQMQNEMRSLAKEYAKQATPIKENLSRYQAAEKAIASSELPKHHQQYLLSQLRSKKGLTYDQDGMPQYLQADSFAKNVDLKGVYEKFINDYKSDKAPNGVYQVKDPVTGLVEYYANNTNERVDADEVRQGLQLLAWSDPEVQQFILQDAQASGVEIKNAGDFLNHAAPLMEAYTQKAAFNKKDLEFKLGEAGNYRAKQKEDEIGSGYTFDINWGIPAKQGVASPTDLRNSGKALGSQKQSINDEFGKFLKNNGDTIDPLTGLSKSGVDYSDEVSLYNQKLDQVDAQKWELSEIEQAAKRDAGLPNNWTPNEQVLREAEKAYHQAYTAGMASSSRDGGTTEEQRKEAAQRAYEKALDQSSDPSMKAYRTALKKNAKDRTDVRGVTTFGKGARSEMDMIGNRIIAGEWGFVKAKDIATGRELTELNEYGTMTENLGWTTDNGEVQLVYKTGEADKHGNFVPSQNKVSIQAPPELTQHLIKKGYIDPLDLDISRQIGSFGGNVRIGNLAADVEIKRNAETGPSNVTVVLNDGKKRVAFPSTGAAVKFLNNLAKSVNGN
jgi:hypothetical protein